MLRLGTDVVRRQHCATAQVATNFDRGFVKIDGSCPRTACTVFDHRHGARSGMKGGK